jgi:DnaK suppressor protein
MPYMANDNQNQVLDEHTEVIDEQKSTVKRVRKTKPKASEGGTTASLFGIEPYQPKKNEEYMSEGQLEHFRQILNAWKAELMSEVDRTLNTMQDESTALPDVNDRATQEEEFAIELRTRDRERKLIRKIEQSLKRFKVKITVSVKLAVSKSAYAV